jgi:hypothetical protein
MDAGGPSSTSIFVLQQKESLAGFAERCSRVSEAEFCSRYPDPFLLTSMPTDLINAAWSFVISVSRKPLKIGPGEDAGKTPSARVFVGRGPECDVVLAPKSISRRHAVFEKKPDFWHFTDLGSTNGTRLEGKVITPKTPIALRSSPIKIEMGSDVTLWFMLPEDLYAFVSCFVQQLSDTSQSRLPAVGGDMSVAASRKEATPVDNSFVAKLDQGQVTQARISPERAKIAEAETGPLFRPKDPNTTWGDDDTEEKPTSIPTPAPAPRPKKEERPEQADKKLDQAINAITALDSLITTVSVQFKTDEQNMMTIFSAQAKSKMKVTDVADQLYRFGPLMRRVVVTLSTGDGKPVEIYSSE